MELRPLGRHHVTFSPSLYAWSLWPLLIGLLMLLPCAAQPLSVSQPEPPPEPPLYHDPLPRVTPLPVPAPAPPSPAQREIAELFEATLPLFGLDPQHLPGRFRRQVCERIYDYTVLYRKDVQAMLQRADTYIPMIKRLFRQHGLPTYFAYIPLVESAFDEEATHPASGARGLWQFMARTARAYGLKVSQRLDERLHPKRATLAAARYLRVLQDRFGEEAPLHILAAYNFGENNLTRALRRAQTEDIWPLFVHRRLPYQTRDYLIKMVTLWIIVTHPERFQLTFEAVAMPPPSPAVAAPPVTRPVEMAQRAAQSED